MYFIKDGMVFQKTEKGFVELSISAKNKVVVLPELESITIKESEHVEASLDGASAASFEEVAARFGLSEDNPIKAKGVKNTSAKKTAKK